MTAAGRQDAAGGASALELAASITDPTALSVLVNGTVSGWIYSFPFTITVDPNTPAEEKMKCSTIVGASPATITVIQRGYDGTVPTTHGLGAAVTHTLPAAVVMDLERHVYDVTEDDHTQYLNALRHADPAHHEFGTPPDVFAFGAGATAPADVGTSASPGGGASPARDDHIHKLGAGSVASFGIVNSALLGLTADIAPVGNAAAAGTASKFARADHVHNVDSVMTYAQISALAGANLWVGRVVYQTDTGTNRPNVGLYTYISATTGWRLPWNQPWGVIGPVAESTANQTSVTAPVDVTGCTNTFTAVANRRYKVTGITRMASNNATDNVACSITNAAGGLLQYAQQNIDVNNADVLFQLTLDTTTPSVAGSYTFKLRANRVSGSTGSVTVLSDPTFPSQLTVEDIGPAGNPA